jgi:Protein of unknown function (DUF2748)
MSSLYHILDKLPDLDPYDIQIEYEELAKELVNGGKMRVDTDMYCNFARFTDPRLGTNLMFSKEELIDQKLIPETRKIFAGIYGKSLSSKELEIKINAIFKQLLSQINKLLPVSVELMMNLARIFVQSAHPIAIKWLLHDKVEVFITYSHNIGDMMDMVSWKHSGGNSGMQRTDGKSVAIFVSCGGNPFEENSKDHPTIGDGWAAIARMQIIAAQEIGHFADIKRDIYGRQIGRYSANFECTAPSDEARVGRINDIKNCDNLLTQLQKAGLTGLIKYDESLKFYTKNNVSNIQTLLLELMQFIYKQKLLRYAHNNKLIFVKRFKKERYMGTMIRAMILDMQSNLSPNADVYKRDNQDAEEAIACIEALARVPQQVMKWGYLTTSYVMKDLYTIYYKTVIPSLVYNYQAMTNKPYRRNYSYPKKTLLYYIKKLARFQKDDIKLVEVREI